MKIIRAYSLALGIFLSKIDLGKLEREVADEMKFRQEILPPDQKNPSMNYYPISTAEF